MFHFPGFVFEPVDAPNLINRVTWTVSRSFDVYSNLDPGPQLRAVNDEINLVRYVLDTENLWKAPDVFLEEGGDCEDYAVAKYAALRKIGWEANNLAIIVLDLLQDGKRISHAVLGARGPEDVILDLGQTISLVEHYRANHSAIPRFSLNEDQVWLY